MQSSFARDSSHLDTTAATFPTVDVHPGNPSEFRGQKLTGGRACILGVGTANPANCVQQDEYTDWYFHITKSDHLTDMKSMMKRICEMTDVKKRYLQMDEDLLREHPEFLDPAAVTLPTRLAIVATVMPELVAAAAAKAIAEWGRPARDITHLVFSSSTCVQVPAIDVRVATLLGLSPDVQRTVMCSYGCTGSSSTLRVAKDIAENNRGARVLVTCADMLSVVGGHVPDDARPAGIIAHALFGDGAGVVIIGADPQEPQERPVFEMVSASQTTVPGTEHVVAMELTKNGTDYRIEPAELTAHFGGNIERCMIDALAPLGIGSVDWNDLFWVLHPGGPVIIDTFAAALGLEPGKLAASWRVLSEYGNMTGPTLIFVLDEVIRRRRQNHEDGSCEWGFMVGLGPGINIEVMALHACRDKSTPTTPRLNSALWVNGSHRMRKQETLMIRLHLNKTVHYTTSTTFCRTNNTFRQENLCSIFDHQ